jgi:hypothetical protein
MQLGAESLAKFLLNPRLCPLRLHIQIQPDQGNRTERNNCAGRQESDSDEPFHAQTLPRPSLKKRSKPDSDSSPT